MNTLAIDIHNLSKTFNGKCAVCQVDFQIESGEIFGFLGPNGSGKTTSMRMLCGLLKPDTGTGHCLGYDILKESLEIKKNVGYMTQNFSLYGDLTAEENLDFIARIYQVTDQKQAIKHVFDRLRFSTNNRQKLTRQLSGGWKQRLSLAAAILHQPKLLLLDEPTSGVDPAARREFWEVIHELSDESEMTCLVTTHYLDEIDHCHRIAYIADGHLLATGTTAHVIDESQLTLWIVTGDELTQLSNHLKQQPFIEQATIFGQKLHITSHHVAETDSAIQHYGHQHYHVQKQKPTLEDVFLYLVAKSQRVSS